MKTIYRLICAVCAICCVCSCDDFLDTQNLTMKDTSNFPIDETDAVQMVNGIYSVMNRNLADPEEDPFFVFDIASDDRLGGGSQSNIGAQGRGPSDECLRRLDETSLAAALCRH